LLFSYGTVIHTISISHKVVSFTPIVLAEPATGGEAATFQGSVENYYYVKRVINGVAGHFGSLDILVNNAGITADKTIRKCLLNSSCE